MGDDGKPRGVVTQFGDDLRAVENEAEKLNRRLDAQDRELQQIKTQGRLAIKQVADQDKELLLVKQATSRTEAKVDRIAEKTADFVEVADYAKKTFLLVEWVIKRLLPLVLAFGALIAGTGWLTKN